MLSWRAREWAALLALEHAGCQIWALLCCRRHPHWRLCCDAILLAQDPSWQAHLIGDRHWLRSRRFRFSTWKLGRQYPAVRHSSIDWARRPKLLASPPSKWYAAARKCHAKSCASHSSLKRTPSCQTPRARQEFLPFSFVAQVPTNKASWEVCLPRNHPPATSSGASQSDGNWWWEVNYEWWYFNEAGEWAHKMATCFVANVAGAPCVGECWQLWRLVRSHPSHLWGMGGSRLGRAWDKYSESLPVFWIWQVGGGGKPGKPKQFDLPFTTRQEKLGEIIFLTKEHKPNQRIGWHLLRMAGTDKVASQVQDLLRVELWPKCHLALVSRKYSLANRLEKTEQYLVRDSFGVSFVPEFDVVFHLSKI